MTCRPALALLTTGLALACSACGNREIEKNFARRSQNLRTTVGLMVEEEQRRPACLEKTAGFIERQNKHDVQKTVVENPTTMREWFNEEFNRWERLQPAYQEAIGHELGGNLESIEHTIPYFID
jgi:hypothetical protein